MSDEEKLSKNDSNDSDGQLLLDLEFEDDNMNPFDTYEIIKKRIWVTGDTFGYCDGHAREAYVIKKNGHIGQEEFSSLEAAQKYIDDFLTKDKEEMVDCRYYFDKDSYWKPSSD